LAALLNLLPETDRLVFCGDVINRGPRIAETMELVWQLVTSGRAVWLKGNHEADLLTALQRQELVVESQSTSHLSASQPAASQPATSQPAAQRLLAGNDTYRQLGAGNCRRWRQRLAQLPEVYWGAGWAATHAGFDPFTWNPSLDIRLPFWQHYDGRYGTVVVGHTPAAEVRHVGEIVIVDTGACYGGKLSAYCPETGELRQVPGLRSWSALGLEQRVPGGPALAGCRF
jgi:serine/threonine protein phosphatase 1